MDPAEMLTLAAIAYRGCEFNLSNLFSRKIVYDEIARCLKTFSAVRGKWDLAWGPAGCRLGDTGTDDSAMYVVRGAQQRPALAIVIRGTNFFSLRDWLSNLLVDPKPWSYGGAANDVTISHSTWLGLGILQRLRSGPVPPKPVTETPVEQAQAAATAAEAGLAYYFLKKTIEGTAPFEAITYLANIFKKLTATMIADSVASGDDAGLLKGVEDLQPPSASADTLLQFLRNFVANAAGPVNIYVVGHSKGGALAPVLALWLADTQGRAVVDPAQWDLESKAILHLYSFAAPTAGNAGFADRFKQRISDAYRLANPYDIVPHAWDPNEVREIPDLYGDQLQALKLPANALALALQVVAYQHEVPGALWLGTGVAQSNFLQRAGVEHLDSYLRELGLYDDGSLSTLALFAPIH
jgi:Lipase (class 3)